MATLVIQKIIVHYKGSRIEIIEHSDGIFSYEVPGSRIQGTGQRSAEEAAEAARVKINEADAEISRTISRALQ